MPELPLFPLNVVLFPGMMLPLHIFETRYKAMVAYCLDRNTPFGILLTKAGRGVEEVPSVYATGTTAQIIECEKESAGCMNIMSLGRQRFRLLRVIRTTPYLVGEIEYQPFRGDESGEIRARGERVRPSLMAYLRLLTKTARVDLNLDELSTSPAALGILTAIVLQLANEEKQELLESLSYGMLLAQEERLLARERVLLQFMLDTANAEEGSPFRPLLCLN
jgi:Lon protease-like protein